MTARRRGVRGFDGSVLRAVRTARGMSEEDLGRATGMSTALICAYEDGRRVPEWKTLAALAVSLSTTVGGLRPGRAATMEDLRCGVGQDQAVAAAAAGLSRSGYAMLENGHTRTLKPSVAAKLAASWKVDEGQVVRAHSAGIQAIGRQALVLEGAVLDGLASHFGVSPQALLDLARTMQNRADRNQTERRNS
ncbi:helix-turn-helix transcriptional regulator [Streptomyces sp. NPDC047525]|uniref:helix-turn-helix domain-containing protein n=1 Tax=Streptomyces sp. NPDC047525 TaxID=3155264 RepID=UPI003402E905